ncbi:hypothetical protein BYT27DRAFT_7260986 [Phlegmacium glaucopus]|nr:hypothetical protein BYT27DRAFT_7260986 [Phlegmacium glaucopus]
MLGRDPAENKIGVKKPEQNVCKTSLPNIWCISITKGTDAQSVTIVTHCVNNNHYLLTPFPLFILVMDTIFLDNLFLDEMLTFPSEEDPSLQASEEDPEAENDDVNGFLTTDDKEDLSDISVKNTRSKKEKLETTFALILLEERRPGRRHHIYLRKTDAIYV